MIVIIIIIVVVVVVINDDDVCVSYFMHFVVASLLHRDDFQDTHTCIAIRY